MVTARLAIGSVSILALGALAIGSAPYWLHRGATGTVSTPWGAIASLDVNRAEAAQPDERAKLLQLAALKSGSPADPSSASASTVSAPFVQPAPVASAPAVSPSEPDSAAVLPQSAEQVSPAPVSQQVASIEDTQTATTVATDGTGKSETAARININTASSNALDHIPGAGRIGHAIVSHRPYKSVKDLVNRRILRMSDYQKIQARISVD